MADDLDRFFAKKKATKKTAKAEDTDVLARRLEKAVRQQEQIDRDREEEERRERAQLDLQRADNEESEWLEAPETQDVDVAALGIQELDIEHMDQDENIIDDDMQEKPKTWNIAPDKVGEPASSQEGKTEIEDEMKPAQVEVVVKQPEPPKKYVAPGMRHTAGRAGVEVQPDFQNVEEFPSLAAADELSKIETEKKKKQAQRSKDFNEHQQKLMQERNDKEPTPSKLPSPPPPQHPPVAEPSVSSSPKPGAYIPPHLRKKEEHQQVSTQNRFANLKD